MFDLEPAASTLRRTADGIGDDQLDVATPCDVPVADLLVHVLGLTAAFRESAGKVRSPLTESPPALGVGELPADWRERLPTLLDELVAAWHEPASWEGTTRIAGMDLPAPEVGVVVNNELVLHAWDLAVATGQPYEAHPGNLEASWRMVSGTPDDAAARNGLFGPPVAVPADAPLLERVLAGSGRDPRWAPTG